jgi:type IV secretion system protein TrbC
MLKLYRQLARSRTFVVRVGITVAITLFILPASAFAEPPWERAVRVLSDSFTGPIARGLSLVAIVVGGLVYAFDTGDSKRVVAGLIFGCGMALGAASFMTWLFQ